jgi:hypothetical protein
VKLYRSKDHFPYFTMRYTTVRRGTLQKAERFSSSGNRGSRINLRSSLFSIHIYCTYFLRTLAYNLQSCKVVLMVLTVSSGFHKSSQRQAFLHFIGTAISTSLFCEYSVVHFFIWGHGSIRAFFPFDPRYLGIPTSRPSDCFLPIANMPIDEALNFVYS